MGDGEEGESGVVEERDPGVLETDPTGRFSRVRAPTPPPPGPGAFSAALCASVCTARSPRRGLRFRAALLLAREEAAEEVAGRAAGRRPPGRGCLFFFSLSLFFHRRAEKRSPIF